MRTAFAVAAAVLAAACTRHDLPEHDAFPAVGTLVEVAIRADDPPAAFRAVRAAFAHADREWHAWGDGALGRYNASGDRVLPPDLEALVARADALRDASGGLFEPRIGALVEAWGFHDAEAYGGPPPEDAIEAWLAGALPPRLDLGAVAKGAAVADAVATLRRQGVRGALVNAGGDVAAVGDAGGRPWRIGIRDPRGVGVVTGVELADGESIFTSGDYERRYERDGIAYHHILDPRTGRPARGTASLTVVHGDPVIADAAATALFVAGDAWPSVARALGVDQVLRIREDGRIEASPALAARLLDAPRDLAVIGDAHPR